MIQAATRAKQRTATFLAALVLVIAAAFGSLAVTFLAGTKTGAVLGIAAIGGPILAYAAIVAPLAFPFGVYVALVPFNNLLDMSSFGTLTKLLAIVSAGAILFYLVRTHRVVRPPRALLWWGALFVWMGATSFWALDQPSVFDLLPTAAELLALYAIVAMLPANDRTFRWVSLACIAGGIMAALYGAYLFHSGADIYYGGRLRITTDTSAIDPNHFAAALLLPIALCTAGALYARKPIVALGYLAALLALFVGVAESASRGAALGIGAMMLYFLWRSEKRVKLLLCSIPPLLMVSLVNNGAIWQRFGQAMSTGGSGRVPIWKVGLTAFKMHWLLGAGYNNFPFAYDQAFLQTNQTQMLDWHRASHNLLVGSGVELGVIGLAILIVAWIAQFRMLRSIEPADRAYPLRMALEGTVIATFVAALFLDVMITKYVWLTFMLMTIVRNAYLARSPRHA